MLQELALPQTDSCKTIVITPPNHSHLRQLPEPHSLNHSVSIEHGNKVLTNERQTKIIHSFVIIIINKVLFIKYSTEVIYILRISEVPYLQAPCLHS